MIFPSSNTVTLNCNGRLLTLDEPVVMGILNATPDSFYTQGRNNSVSSLCKTAEQMIADGADILDIGGVSTRPQAPDISEQEEAERVIPAISAIRKIFPNTFISIDTFRSSIASMAVDAGADIVNDISAGNIDDHMLSTVGRLNVPYIAMHMQGLPDNMQNDPQYSNVVLDITGFFIEKIKQCTRAGIKDIIIDPGFGFGKTLRHNYDLLKGLRHFQILDKVVLTGISRKSMIYKLLSTTADEAINGTTALHMLCLQNGANILRVHDVKEAKESIRLFQYYQTGP